MFSLYADKNKLTVRRREAVTSGSVNVYQVQIDFSPEWEGLSKLVVFQAGENSRTVLLEENHYVCTIPWEVLAVYGQRLLVGVYGAQGKDVVLPTVWANLGVILEGVPGDGEGSRPPTPDLWEQELAQKGDGAGLYGRGRAWAICR